MKNSYTVLEGKFFSVDLISNMCSTDYGWCLTEMPKEIILLGTEIVPIDSVMVGGRTVQRFHFGVRSSKNVQVTLQFELTCMSELSKATDVYTLDVQIIPCNSEDYVKYSENEEQAAIPYGYVNDSNANPFVKYGYPCNVAYGYPGGIDYGYPCATQGTMPPFVKYGYPCTVAYGYPNGGRNLR